MNFLTNVTNDEGDEYEKVVSVVFIVCPTCNGKGSHVNPNIDSHGLCSDDFYDDPEFEEDYFSGVYDVSCNECFGKRVVPATHDKEVNEWIQQRDDDDYYDRQVMAAECGWR